MCETCDIKQGEINRLRSVVRELGTRLDQGRDYLMSKSSEKVNISDALKAFGYQGNGLDIN